MEHSTLIVLSGDPAVDGGLVHPAGRLWPGHNVQAMSRSARTQALEHSPRPTQTKVPRQCDDGERPEQAPSAATPASDGHDGNLTTLLGTSKTAFVEESAVSRARSLIAEYQPVVLSHEEFFRFADALDAAPVAVPELVDLFAQQSQIPQQ